MSVHDRHIRTNPPFNGLSPEVLNMPMQWVGAVKASLSGAIVTKTQQTAGSSVAAGTQPDYARNLNVVITPTASSVGVTGGGVSIWGRDVFGNTRSETYNSLAISSAAGQDGVINFASIDTISMSLSFLAATSTAASAFAVHVGVGQKIGLPINIRSTNAVYALYLGTSKQRISYGASSTNNLFTVVTGDYYVNGISQSDVYASATPLRAEFFAMGAAIPRPVPV